ncbi:seven-hairpin glycosidase [Rhizodiscina lignyota]|uniref:alpha-1,2-Mannosidase n=1 Tax=Rhizodiscina lignyota TaxID=1504668 RepID=A0A9P4M0W6_9PEZI|nr:seven-hairpin glycosidase [Rhizodiscina lignyota]
MLPFRRNPDTAFKLFSVTFIVVFYLLYSSFYDPPLKLERTSKPSGPKVQNETWQGDTARADVARLKRVEEAMKHSFHGYRVKAWGYDDIRPVSGRPANSSYGWGGYILEAAPSLAVMGLWEEFALCLDHIVERIDFSRTQVLVDPAIATKRYLGSLVSLLELADTEVVAEGNITAAEREKIMDKAVILANKLLPAYATTAGLPFPRVDFLTGDGMPRPASFDSDMKPRPQEYSIEPSDAATILELAGLTRLSGNTEYYMRAIQAWAPLIWDKFVEPFPGLIAGPFDIFSAEPERLQRHWDAGHGDFYETLLKAVMFAPKDKLAPTYQRRWLQSAYAVRHNLTSRSLPADNHLTQHMYLGKWDSEWYLNEMSQEACSAAGVIILGARFMERPDLFPLGQAILEGCRYVYTSSSCNLGADRWSWQPMSVSRNGTFGPTTNRSSTELNEHSYWVSDSSYKFQPNYFASLFHAFRVTGEQRYRDWAWDAFNAFDRDCKTPFGYAGLSDVMEGYAGRANWADDVDGGMVLETLKWLWLIFADTDVMSLDRWIFTTGGYPLRRG